MKSRIPSFVAAAFMLIYLFGTIPVSAAAETLSSQEKTGVYLNEVGIGTGYAWTSLKGASDDLSIYPVFVRLGFNANTLFGIQSSKNSLQLTLEPFVNPLSGQEDGVEAGCGFGIRYLHEAAGPVDLFLEASIAPMFYSIDTIEQGKAGFNFLDQIGGGLRYRFAPDKAIFGGYRWRHISHANLVDRSNDGINSNAIVVGFSWLY